MPGVLIWSRDYKPYERGVFTSQIRLPSFSLLLYSTFRVRLLLYLITNQAVKVGMVQKLTFEVWSDFV